MKRRLSDEEHRLDYLVDQGFPSKQARERVENHSPTFGESMYVISQRIGEIGEVIKRAMPSINPNNKKEDKDG